MIAGKNLYEMHCGNCHGNNGEGLRQLYPALNKSERLDDIPYITCLIKTGTSDLETNMPANKELYNLDIAQIITYMNSKWNDGQQIIETEEIAKVVCD